MEPQAIAFDPHGWVPNNPNFPVLLYRAALDGSNLPEEFEGLFRKNGWGGLWRNGVYAFHHYHSTAHEVLGIAAGAARLLIGGPDGREIELLAGDAVILRRVQVIAGSKRAPASSSLGDIRRISRPTYVVKSRPPSKGRGSRGSVLRRPIPSREKTVACGRCGIGAADRDSLPSADQQRIVVQCLTAHLAEHVDQILDGERFPVVAVNV
jgi:uncharacterized protein YjlB